MCYNKTMKRLSILALSGFSLCGFAAERVTNTWDKAMAPGGNAPGTAYEWTNTANWQIKSDAAIPDGVAAGASIQYDSKIRFIAFPMTANGTRKVTLSKFDASCVNDRFLGDIDFVRSNGDRNRCTCGHANPIVYGNVTYLGPNSSAENYEYLGGNIAGRIIIGPLANAAMSTCVKLRTDLFAEDANPVRQPVFPTDFSFDIDNGGIWLYGPRGSEAKSVAYDVTSDSPFAKAAGADEAVAPGATVTGAGIPDGTFVRRVFPGTGWLELSAKATNTAAGAVLSFGAITPSIEQPVKYLARQSQPNAGYRVLKYREEDTCVLNLKKLTLLNYPDKSTYYGVPSNELAPFVLGDLVIDQLVCSGDVRTNDLYSVRLRFGDGVIAGEGKKGIVWRLHPENTARFTALAGTRTGLARFVGLGGVVEKRGAGTFYLGLQERCASTLKVDEGVLEVGLPSGAAPARPRTARVEVAAGATLKLAAEGLFAETASLAADATVEGPGSLYLSPAAFASVPASVRRTNGAMIVLAEGVGEGGYVPSLDALEDKPAGTPAFWLDADFPESVVTDGNGGVTRWNDRRFQTSGDWMFCTNIVYKPTYVNGADRQSRYVKISRRTNTYGWISNTEELVWSQPLKIKAFFYVQDPVDGGGDLLGRTTRVSANIPGQNGQGGPYYAGSSNPSTLVYGKYGMDAVTNGVFVLDGKRIDGCKTGYAKNGGLQLLEHYVNSSYTPDVWCDAFGTGYKDGGLNSGGTYYIDSENGGQRIAEFVIYTNDLTYAEQLQTANYLSRKWMGRLVHVQNVSPEAVVPKAEGVRGVDAEEGETLAVAEIGADGEVVKSGAGRLYVQSCQAASIRVAGGELLVKSLETASPESLIDGAFIHLDASDAATVLTNSAGSFVEWTDVDPDRKMSAKAKAGTPKVVPGPNGRQMIDLGDFSTTTGSAALRLYHDGQGYEHVNDGDVGYVKDLPYEKTFFAVYRAKGGGGSLFGGWDCGYPSQGLPHATAGGPIFCTVPDRSYWAMAFGSSTAGLSMAVSNGTAIVRQNQAKVDPFVQGFTDDYETFAFSSGCGRKTDAIALYGQGASYTGGFECGEVLIYPQTFTAAEVDRTEAYLVKRWFDRDTPGLMASCGTLDVAEGATVKLVTQRVADVADFSFPFGVGAMTVGTVSGGGVVEGDLKLTDGFAANVKADGSVPSLTVNGTLTVPTAGVLTLTDPDGKIKVGTHVLAAATALDAADVLVWTVVTDSRRRRNYRIYVEDNALMLEVSPCGMMLLVK